MAEPWLGVETTPPQTCSAQLCGTIYPDDGDEWDAAALERLGLEQVGRGLVRSSRLLRGLPEWQGRKSPKQGTADPAFLLASEQGQSVAYKGQ